MARGGFIDHHFSFTGDGRSNGTETGGSGLGDAQQLALSITANVALQLKAAGWVTSNELFSGTTTTTQVTVGGETFYTNAAQATSYVIEMPMTYGSGENITKIWLMYAYQSSSGSVAYLDKTVWSNYLGSASYLWGQHSSAIALGLSIMYCPPKCSKTNSLKLANGLWNSGSTLSGVNSSGYYYTYHVVTKGNYIAIGLHNSADNTGFLFYNIGPLYNEFFDSLDTSCEYKEYGALNGLCDSYAPSMSEYRSFSGASFYKYISCGNVNNSARNLVAYDTPVWTQFYNTEGQAQATSCYFTYDSSVASTGLFYSCSDLVNVLNTQSLTSDPRKVYYSKVIVGNIPGNNSDNWNKKSKISSNNFIKGTIDPDYVITVGNGYNVYQTQYSTPFPIGQTFDGGNYVHIGSGICIGWDSGNTLSILDNSSNTMQAASIVQS